MIRVCFAIALHLGVLSCNVTSSSSTFKKLGGDKTNFSVYNLGFSGYERNLVFGLAI